MNDSLARLQSEAKKIWGNLGRVQRIALMLVAGGFVVALMYFVTMSGQTEYGVLYGNMSEQDAGSIVAKLKEAKVPYELTNNGTTIKVPADQVAEMRLQMAAAGLPQGGSVGFELFDKSSFGLTDFAQQLNYQRALEGELARTISQLNVIEQARIHIVIPKAELYTDKLKPTTASVVLKLKSGAQLKREQVRAISNLVSGSVEGLKPENISIIDTAGAILSDSSGDNQAGLTTEATTTQLDMQASFQKNLEQEAQSLLSQTLGPNKAAVKVNAVMDWDKTESDSETYLPNGATPQIRSSHELVENYGGNTGATVGGVPGVSSNIPSYSGIASTTATANSSTPSGYGKSDKTNNYELSKVVSHTVKAPGAVKRMSVAVLVDDVTDDAQLQKIQNIVTSAVGLDSSRGDTITVASMPFNRTAETEQAKALKEADQMNQYFEYGKLGVIVIVFIIGFMFLRSLTKGLKPQPEAKPQALLDAAMAPPIPTITVTKPTAQDLIQKQQELAETQKKRQLQQQQLSNLARSQPVAMANLVKTWMDEK